MFTSAGTTSTLTSRPVLQKKQSEVSKSSASRNIHKRQWGLKLRTCDIHLSNMAIHWTENYSNFFYFCHNLKVDNISITLSLLFFIYTFHKFYKTTERNLFQSMSTQAPILTEALTARGDFWNECLKNHNSKSSHSGWLKHRLTLHYRTFRGEKTQVTKAWVCFWHLIG